MKELQDFIYELGMLKRTDREGWKVCGIDKPESVSEHSLRAAQIGYILAYLENYDKPEKVATTLVFHELGECRIGDIHKIASKYLTYKEEDVVNNQTEKINDIGKKIFKLWKKIEKPVDKPGIIAKDADLVEMAFTAREYMQIGYSRASRWIDSSYKRVKTKSAKKMIKNLKKSNPSEWWTKLKKEDI
ncbi:MAG: HD domain-containing protein [Candidatus Thermoplasmatota archaeon]